MWLLSPATEMWPNRNSFELVVSEVNWREFPAGSSSHYVLFAHPTAMVAVAIRKHHRPRMPA
ncbi:MAG: hypothetical protein ACE5FI_10775, partial [Anaerolineales bacterium]